MYLVAFVLFVVLGKLRARQNLLTGWHPRDVDDMLFYGVFGVILGGRLGYVLFYKPLYYLQHPLEIFAVWQGGMSFHGGFLGVLFAMWLFARTRAQALARRHRLRRAAGAAGARRRAARQLHQRRAVGARDRRALGRWCSRRSDREPRHPSQLYQFALEGLLLFVVLWWLHAAPASAGRGVRAVPDRLRRVPLRRRVRARAGQLPRAAGARPDDGAVAVAADDRRRHRHDASGPTGAPARTSRR